MPSNVLPLHLKQTFPHTIWIFTEGDGIESRLPFKMFSTLWKKMIYLSGLVIYVSLNAYYKLFPLFILGKKKQEFSVKTWTMLSFRDLFLKYIQPSEWKIITIFLSSTALANHAKIIFLIVDRL